MELALSPNELNRVRRNTSQRVLEQIDAQIERNIRYYAVQTRHEIERRIEELEKEWSVERWLEVSGATVGLTTSMLALTVNRKWGLLACMGLGFFLLHALQGFDPPLPLLRRMGIRTRGEIDREVYALKALRGDLPKAARHEASGEIDDQAAQIAKAVRDESNAGWQSH